MVLLALKNHMKTHKPVYFRNAFAINASVTSSPRDFNLYEARLPQQALSQPLKCTSRNLSCQEMMKLLLPTLGLGNVAFNQLDLMVLPISSIFSWGGFVYSTHIFNHRLWIYLFLLLGKLS
ncbi:MAG: hypothetical protein AW11_01883 [Candidatus Accumulibacter regalis]|uniref:Uncharacterized protein n=1 Tax=Accumulibacter regalis TaxID=522306 RepID=A0A011QI19_ACCRE|nr:MAG: hypothetical protein AW11_01883 [Candidatus Accumulibacter regalis]